jgi:hypothetical protein
MFLRKDYHKILRKTGLIPNTSASLQTTLAAEAHLAEGQFLLEGQTLSKTQSLYRQQELEGQQFSKGRTEFRATVTLKKQQFIGVITSSYLRVYNFNCSKACA